MYVLFLFLFVTFSSVGLAPMDFLSYSSLARYVYTLSFCSMRAAKREKPVGGLDFAGGAYRILSAREHNMDLAKKETAVVRAYPHV